MASILTHLFPAGPLLGLLLVPAFTPAAQAQTLPGAGATLAAQLSRYQQKALPEKLFLHLDRPAYFSGETLWFKVYAADGTYSRPLALSAVAYVEVLNTRQQPVLQAKVALRQAQGQGSFDLPSSLASGVYTVRAYTSWMQNFGPAQFFQTSVTVINPQAAAATPRPDSTAFDVQVFPEGGHLVQGLSSKVGVKVTGTNGVGLAAQGQVLNQAGAVVASFRTLRYGMGSFTFTPRPGATYTAVVTPSGQRPGRRPLPPAQPQGYVLRLEAPSGGTISATITSTTAQPETVYLLGHSRQKVVVAAQAEVVNGRATVTLDRSQLLDGVTHFTLFNAARQPLCERLYFQPPRQRLAISARPDKAAYPPRNKVTLDLATASTSDVPATVGAALSVAVYRLDSLNATTPIPDIASYLWLTSELRGTVEHPEYYLHSTDPEAAEAADNLMLTQGWSRFRWEQVLAPTPPVFTNLPELNGPLVRARLTRAGTNQPAAGVTTFLSSPSRLIQLHNAVSDAQGLVQFELSNLYGPREITVQTNPQQDSTCHVELLPSFSSEPAAVPAVGFALQPHWRQEYARRYFQQQVQSAFSSPTHSRYLLPATDSAAFYGKADETYLLDKYTRFKVLEEVMREYVPGVLVRLRKDGFHFMVVDRINRTTFEDNPMVLLDGVPVFNINKMMAMNPLKIQKLEVMASRYFHGPSVYNGLVSFTTYRGDLEGFQLDPRVLVQRYEGLQGQREFYAPRYDTPQARQSRLPDLRNLLYWNPNVATTGPETQKLEFYTGDQAGRYLVVVQGLSGTGLAGSTSITFEVKQPL